MVPTATNLSFDRTEVISYSTASYLSAIEVEISNKIILPFADPINYL